MIEIRFDTFPTLTTERLVLRAIKDEDAEALFELRADPGVMRYIGRPLAQTVTDAQKLIDGFKTVENDGTAVIWGITMKGNDKLLGTICIWNLQRQHFRAEVGYLLHPDYWKQGILSEVMAAVLPVGFDQVGLHSIEANVSPENTASRRLLEKFGFVQEAHFRENFYFNGEFLDSIIYSLLVSTYKQRLTSSQT